MYGGTRDQSAADTEEGKEVGGMENSSQFDDLDIVKQGRGVKVRLRIQIMEIVCFAHINLCVKCVRLARLASVLAFITV